MAGPSHGMKGIDNMKIYSVMNVQGGVGKTGRTPAHAGGAPFSLEGDGSADSA